MLNQDLIKGAPAAAKFCGLPKRTIYHLVEIGTLPCTRMGKTLYFRRSELEAAFRSAAA